ncbi:MAG TPA: YfiR family protein [Candidatus Ozemobacteraceae bacterium]|nr:YfiR family protein [Candidatus Ozemobacteraceae bacterium]
MKQSIRQFRHRCALFLGVLWLISAGFQPVAASGKPLGEFQVKAAFLLKFAAFVEWPPEIVATPSPMIRLGIIGHDPFGNILPPEIHANEAEGISYLIDRQTIHEPLASGCRLIYIGVEDSDATASLLSRIADQPILTVGEGEAFVKAGGMIAFILENNRVRFLINNKRARSVNIRISSQLLNIAKVVVP